MTVFKIIHEQSLDVDEYNQATEVHRARIEIILDDEVDPETYDFLAGKLGLEVYTALQLPRPDEDWLRLRPAWAKLSKEERAAFAAKVEQIAAANQARIIETGGNGDD
jgi:hypothetical protein